MTEPPVFWPTQVFGRVSSFEMKRVTPQVFFSVVAAASFGVTMLAMTAGCMNRAQPDLPPAFRYRNPAIEHAKLQAWMPDQWVGLEQHPFPCEVQFSEPTRNFSFAQQQYGDPFHGEHLQIFVYDEPDKAPRQFKPQDGELFQIGNYPAQFRYVARGEYGSGEIIVCRRITVRVMGSGCREDELRQAMQSLPLDQLAAMVPPANKGLPVQQYSRRD